VDGDTRFFGVSHLFCGVLPSIGSTFVLSRCKFSSPGTSAMAWPELGDMWISGSNPVTLISLKRFCCSMGMSKIHSGIDLHFRPSNGKRYGLRNALMPCRAQCRGMRPSVIEGGSGLLSDQPLSSTYCPPHHLCKTCFRSVSTLLFNSGTFSK
jgi:hypothetical protein